MHGPPRLQPWCSQGSRALLRRSQGSGPAVAPVRVWAYLLPTKSLGLAVAPHRVWAVQWPVMGLGPAVAPPRVWALLWPRQESWPCCDPVESLGHAVALSRVWALLWLHIPSLHTHPICIHIPSLHTLSNSGEDFSNSVQWKLCYLLSLLYIVVAICMYRRVVKKVIAYQNIPLSYKECTHIQNNWFCRLHAIFHRKVHHILTHVECCRYTHTLNAYVCIFCNTLKIAF